MTLNLQYMGSNLAMGVYEDTASMSTTIEPELVSRELVVDSNKEGLGFFWSFDVAVCACSIIDNSGNCHPLWSWGGLVAVQSPPTLRCIIQPIQLFVVVLYW